ncbi:MAG: ORF6N domain-containing protein [Flavobacteriales bacterium]|nr:ORF6N domain-containing protein [Flavobacteriales bacterium]
MKGELVLPDEAIAARIHWIRGEKVMLAHDLAQLYEVPTYRLNEAVKRNLARFPEDFMLQLTTEEWSNLTSQFAMSREWGGRRRPPYAFTEHGVLMLSSVLNGERAIAVNIRIVRVFVRLSRLLQSDRDLQRRMAQMEERQTTSEDALAELFEAVKQLMARPAQDRKRLGFKRGDDV